MKADIHASLRKLTTLSQTLNEASDTLAAELNSVENALNKLKLGVTAWVMIRSEDLGEGESHVCSLGYCKDKGKWGLVLFQCIDGMQPDGTVTPLREAPRELRIEAADKLGELIEELATKATRTTEKIVQQVAQAKEIASSLSKGRT